MKLWAIKWGPYPNNRGHGWIDWTTIARTRRDAWAAFTANESPHATANWKATLKRRRRLGWIRAIRIDVTEAV
jgi:hypothetical protein